ncbi:uncharacterized protein LOC114254929 isoform X2 [Monomorium pharaonis]|nr:uncharacterized protein LOC114254929 isoform X2 [Monomorium pharaonis]XP_036140272.1 uncharacterized protein LOC114254929 isoform X2 [Monomorium pharaonis]
MDGVGDGSFPPPPGGGFKAGRCIWSPVPFTVPGTRFRSPESPLVLLERSGYAAGCRCSGHVFQFLGAAAAAAGCLSDALGLPRPSGFVLRTHWTPSRRIWTTHEKGSRIFFGCCLDCWIAFT